MSALTPEEQARQIAYRDARFTDQYDDIWQTVGKCIFCDLRDKYIIREENGVVMTVSLYAYIDGHLLIAPRRHIRSPKDLTAVEWATVRKFSYLAKKLIKDTHGIKGIQIVQKDGATAQSTVSDHLHFHAVPFDAPDLCQWNYRHLKYTPLENAQLYQKAGRKIAKLDERYEQKYRRDGGLPLLCDLIIINTRQEVLFEERHNWAKVGPGYITMPGGGVDDYTGSLEAELAREVHEETGATIDITALKLVASRFELLQGADRRNYPAGGKRVLWNTYVLRDFDPTTKLTPGDDAKDLLWIPLADIASHPRISDGVKLAIRSITL